MKSAYKKKSVKSHKINTGMCLQSKPVLYLTLTVALFNLFGYLMTDQFDAVAVFVLSGISATMFSKNMIVVLLSSISLSLLLVLIKYARNTSEGFEEKDKDPKTTTTATADTATADTAATKTTTTTDAKAGIKKPVVTKEKFEQRVTPSRYGDDTNNDDNTDNTNTNTYKPKVDYISTIESAYDNLDKFLGSDAIKNMTADTAKLAEKQQQLVGNLEKIGPIMDKAGTILDKMPSIEKMTGLMGGLQDRIKGFTKK